MRNADVINAHLDKLDLVLELESDSVQSGADLDSLEYPEHWRTAKAKQLDQWIPAVTSWLSDLPEQPKEVSEAEWKAFEKFAVKFFIAKDVDYFDERKVKDTIVSISNQTGE